MDRIIFDNSIIKGTFSVSIGEYEKAQLAKIDNDKYQISFYTKTQVFHKNFSIDNIEDEINRIINNEFKNIELFSNEYIFSYRKTKKGNILNNKRKNQSFINLSINHNRKKEYILDENIIIPALCDLGITSNDGKVLPSGYSKYKQINRFLEIINDSIKNEKNLKIIDFGCGKSYLTFILYHFLVYVKKINCTILGLDLKEDVILNCNKIAKKYNYKNLEFKCGNIEDFKDLNFDMIVTLHACDTATDYALYHAICMKCKYIFSVPCCQHEINMKLKKDKLNIMNKYGIIKERFSALLTDSIRANILEYMGYKVNIMEFVDYDSSPKNLLIRANLTNNRNLKIKDDIDKILEEYQIDQKLYDLVFKNN